MKNVCLLGATGSVGSQVLNVIDRYSDVFRLYAFSYGDNIEKAKEIIDKYHPAFVVSKNNKNAQELHEMYPDIDMSTGNIGLQQMVGLVCENPIIVNALVGSIGLIPTAAAISMKRDVYLANKESLVMAGELIIPMAHENGVSIIPIDSEHSAVFQLMEGLDKSDIEKIVITSSGGSLRDIPLNELENVTKDKVLNHPTWKMGEKITVDCATLMNKAFEVVEAHHLFNLPYDKISAVIHPESIVHAFVYLKDHATFALMAQANMEQPISYALLHPRHLENEFLQDLDFEKLHALHFSKIDTLHYPLYEFAIETCKLGGIHPALLNACNEWAVQEFLKEKISYNDIAKIVISEVTNSFYDSLKKGDLSIGKIMMVDELVKSRLSQQYH